MAAISHLNVKNASNATPVNVKGAAPAAVTKKAASPQTASSTKSPQAPPQPALATSGSVGTQVNAVA